MKAIRSVSRMRPRHHETWVRKHGQGVVRKLFSYVRTAEQESRYTKWQRVVSENISNNVRKNEFMRISGN